jgi:hypothetical protein
MIRCSAALALIIGLVPSALADGPAAVAGAKKTAEAMGEALIKGDSAKIVEFTYPKAVELAGGSERMRKSIDEGAAKMQKDGAKFVSCIIGDPGSLFIEGNKTFIVVPETLEITVPKGKIVVKSFLLGISADDGKTWKFLDGIGGGLEKKEALDKFEIRLPAKLKLPDPQRPVFVSSDKK